jgi:hypothetical protein
VNIPVKVCYDLLMTKEELYVSQLDRYVRGEVFDPGLEYETRFGVKAGKFGEGLICEMLGDDLSLLSSERRIRREGGSYYDADGYLPRARIYLESKYLSFWSTGTAPEKLPYFLFKAEKYDKPVVLVLGGMHELLVDEPSRQLWTAYNKPEECDSGAAVALVGAVRHKIAGIVKLSELRSWLDGAKRTVL